MRGVDYPWSKPSPAALKAAGVEFALRYLSHNPSKNLARTEADALAAAGIWCGVVWETTATRPLAGRTAGIDDAREAIKQATACGMPPGRPVYMAVDFDVTATQQAAVDAYLDGAASVLGPDRTGVYGGYATVKRALDRGACRWGWQTYAWSRQLVNGKQTTVWDPRAHIRQGGLITIGGVQCDENTALVADFGQWMPGRTPNATPNEEDDMPTAQEIAEAVWNRPVPIPRLQPDGTVTYDGTQAAYWPLIWQNVWGARAAARDAALQAAIASLAGLLAAQHADLTPEQITEAVRKGIEAGLVHVQVDVNTPANHT